MYDVSADVWRTGNMVTDDKAIGEKSCQTMHTHIATITWANMDALPAFLSFVIPESFCTCHRAPVLAWSKLVADIFAPVMVLAQLFVKIDLELGVEVGRHLSCPGCF